MWERRIESLGGIQDRQMWPLHAIFCFVLARLGIVNEHIMAYPLTTAVATLRMSNATFHYEASLRFDCAMVRQVVPSLIKISHLTEHGKELGILMHQLAVGGPGAHERRILLGVCAYVFV